MKRLLNPIYFAFVITTCVVIYSSCDKDPDEQITGNTNNNNGSAVTPPVSACPVARAGSDTTITLPQNSFLLDGSGSYDSLNRPMQYQWRLINGPPSVSFNTMNTGETVAFFSNHGEYSFQLKVTVLGCSSYDTIKVTVVMPAYCQQNREEIPLQFNLLTQLPVSINFPLIFAVNNKLIVTSRDFYSYSEFPVLVYDQTTSQWTTTHLNTVRDGMAIIAAGTKIYFAGGMTYDNNYNVIATSRVDIYDLTAQTWTISNLSEPRAFVRAIELQGQVFFAGGMKSNRVFSDKMDIYNAQSNTWSAATLPGTKRAIIGATTANNKLFFCGGYTEFADYTGWGEILNMPANDIDIYNVTNGTWTRDTMQTATSQFATYSYDNKLYLAGGIVGVRPDGFGGMPHYSVEIKDVNSFVNSFSCLSSPNTFYNSSVTKKNNYIVFMGDNTYTSTAPGKIDLYNTQNGNWKIGLLPSNSFESYKTSVVDINNDIYIVYEDKIYTMNF